MPVELIAILALLVVLLVSIALNLNMGLAAFVAAFLVGGYVLDLSVEELLGEFPANMFINLLGITFFLGIAYENQTMDWLVAKSIALTGGRLALLPWAFFGVAAVTATLGPAVVFLLIGVGLRLADRYNINPLLAGAMVVHGSQGGSFSPIAPFGVLINQLIESNGLEASPYSLYLVVLASHVVLATIVFFAFGGHRLIGRRATDVENAAGPWVNQPVRLNAGQIATLAGILVLILAVIALHVHIGLAALSIGLALLLFLPRHRRQGALRTMPWGVIVIISGVLTYVGVLQEAGSVTWLGEQLRSVGSPVWIALLLCFMAAIVTAFASTFGTIGLLIPLSVPFLLTGEIQPAAMVAAMVVSAVMTDISPFSTLGALVLASASEGIREALMRAMLVYVACLMLVVPVLTWLLFIVPQWR